VARSIDEVNLVEEDKRVYVLTEFTITPGKVDEFKKIAQEFLNVVKEREPHTLRYQCYFNKDQNKSYVVEEYPNTEAVRVHILHVAIPIRKLLKVSTITKSTVLGDLNPVTRETLSIIGAENFTYWNGLAH
jgi:quinol monooxygenase YgiN